MRKPRCYVVHNKGLDISGAAVYGDIVELYETKPLDVFSTSRHAFQIKEKLRDAEQGDYLVVIGNMILVLITFGILYERFGSVNLLLFDIGSQTYIARVIPRHQLMSNKREE